MTDKRGTVLFLEHEASRTGASIFLLRLLRWLRANCDFDIHILAGRPGEMLPDFRSIATVDTFEPRPTLAYKALRRLKMSNWQDTGHLACLREKLAQSDIRLIYANSVASARMLGFLAFLRCPVICHVHELAGAIQALGPQYIDILETRQPTYIAVSRAVAEALTSRYGIPADRIQMVYGFIPVSEVSQATADSREAVRHEFGIPQDEKLICGCGSIEHRKGTDLFLEVAADMSRRREAGPAHFVWIGGKRQGVDAMQKRVQSSGLGGVLHFAGSRPNVAPYYEAADVFLLTSREDPFPLVMLEAALHEKPIVCFDQTGGAPEFLGHDSGFVVPKFDIGGMSDRVMELLASPDLCRRMGAAAKRKVIGRHDLTVGGPRIARIIENSL